MSTDARAPDRPSQWGLAVLGAVGLAVAAALAAYAESHPGDGAALTALGFSSMLEMKAWLTTAAAALVVVQVLSALAMWGRLPGVHDTPGWVSGLHRWSGTVAFLLTLPVAFHCVWSLGFEDESTRVLVHSVAGCVLYGVFAAKMLALRLRGLPSATVPLLGGLLAGVVVVLWFSSALWFFSRSGEVGY
ncbi:DUF6529 family protein [Cellulomonas xylanilytica]|uniref:Uncharacterized protein n=1 Tax=Cellulomonas xylanilytica TaxID=233583 RepID=A0A510VE50_9CELL|nr:DUF6529 family protein [Cellulomonas xylanilytica]GEK23415.1 hypothetical protein CXY01_39350 [Cellulomonas xylanilytica]